MRILISSHLFAPSIGGIEQVSEIVAGELSQLGHDVCVVTQTSAPPEPCRRYRIERRPGRKGLFELVRWCDVYLQSNLSLNTLWPAIILRKPIVAVHHTWITRPDGSRNWQDYLKIGATRVLTRNLAVSRALAESIPTECGIVPNPYRDDYFRTRPDVPRTRDLAFVGRLVSSKGADLLLEALESLKEQEVTPTLTVIGSGPEEAGLKSMVRERSLEGQVEFAGPRTGEELAVLLGAHKIVVVPSRWEEPFGLVALEGVASGCAVIGSAGGGLPEAIGPCGVTFPNGDFQALAEQIRRLLANPAMIEQFQSRAETHLQPHRPKAVAEFYLREFTALVTN